MLLVLAGTVGTFFRLPRWRAFACRSRAEQRGNGSPAQVCLQELRCPGRKHNPPPGRVLGAAAARWVHATPLQGGVRQHGQGGGPGARLLLQQRAQEFLHPAAAVAGKRRRLRAGDQARERSAACLEGHVQGQKRVQRHAQGPEVRGLFQRLAREGLWRPMANVAASCGNPGGPAAGLRNCGYSWVSQHRCARLGDKNVGTLKVPVQ
mmetsp:Transcript_45420/g.129606  ORF Transcript_45420/g.129606 Transcript_45420/m.129606 type:complete len:207 (-) Transcript_45420:371-991(-)